MTRIVEPVLLHARARAILRVVQRTVIALALVACGEAPTTRPAAGVMPEEPSAVVARIACVANARERSVSCGSDAAATVELSRSIATIPGAVAPDIILGGQNSYVKMTSSNVTYAGEVFSFDATVTNLLDQPIGTSDGVSADPNGIRVFFENPPQRLSGSGVIDYTNPVGGGSLVDGFATFTQSNQAFYRYNEMLTPNQRSALRNWKLHVPSTVGTFQFFVYVSAPVRFAQGTQRAIVVQEPLAGVTNELFTPSIAVKIVSATGVTLTGYTGAVTVSMVPGGPDSGTLSGTLTQNAINGIATFADLRLSGTGTFRLQFTGSGLVPGVTAAFIVSATASPGIAFQRVTYAGTSTPVDLGFVTRSVDVVLHTQANASDFELFLATGSACATNIVGSGDVLVGSAPTTGPSLVTLRVNTAQVTSGNEPVFLDGNYCLKARLHQSSGDSYANALAVTLANGELFLAETAYSRAAGYGKDGRQYNGGDLTVVVTPVHFTPAPPIATMNITLGNPGRVLTLAPVVGTSSFSGTYSSTSGAANAITQYQTSNPAGDRLVVTSAVNTSGQTVSHNDSLATLRIDNVSPTVPVLNAATGFGADGNPCPIANGLPCTNFLAPAFWFDTSASPGFDAVSTVGVTYGVRANDAGYVSLPGGTAVTAAACNPAGWVIHFVADLPNTLGSNSAYRLRRFDMDVFRNERCTDYPNPFGVDGVDPQLAQTAGPPSGSVTGANTEFSYAFTDSISGFIPGHAVDINVLRNFVTCVNPTSQAGGVTVAATTGNGCIAQTSGSGINISPGGEGYHTVTARAVDQAGNRSATIINTVLYDATAPTLTGVSVPSTLVGGTAVSFGANATDNVDLKASGMTLQYSSVALAYAGSTFGPTFDATRVTSSVVTGSAPFFLAQLQSVNGSGAPNPVSANDVAQSVTLRVVDAANHPSIPSTATIASSITSSLGFSTNDFDIFQVTATPQTLSNGAGGGVRQASLVASATLNDFLAQQAPLPFDRVCFYYQVNVTEAALAPLFPAGTYQSIGCVSFPSILDAAGLFRRFDYTLPAFDPPASLGTSGSVNIIAVGARGNGEAIVTNASTAITLVP